MSNPTAAGGQLGPPVCPRHPDRVSYVRCQRCNRPMCPDCQVVAPVGMQCVDCVREQARDQPQRRTVLGAVHREGHPYVTYTIIAACVIVFILQRFSQLSVTSALWFMPVLGVDEPYRFLTSAFVHSPGSLLHIGFNMYALYLVGPFLEQMLGRARFIALYVLAAVGGSTMVLLLANTPEAWFTPVVGASGAVFGLFAAILLVLRRIGRQATQILAIIVINVVIGFVVPGISWQGHLGGLVVGAILGGLFAWAPKERRMLVSWIGVAVVAVGLIAAASVKYAEYGLL